MLLAEFGPGILIGGPALVRKAAGEESGLVGGWAVYAAREAVAVLGVWSELRVALREAPEAQGGAYELGAEDHLGSVVQRGGWERLDIPCVCHI